MAAAVALGLTVIGLGPVGAGSAQAAELAQGEGTTKARGTIVVDDAGSIAGGVGRANHSNDPATLDGQTGQATTAGYGGMSAQGSQAAITQNQIESNDGQSNGQNPGQRNGSSTIRGANVAATTERIELQGVPLRRVNGGPAPLYLAEGVPDEQGTWALDAMRIAWQKVPRFLGLPVPSQEIPVFLFRDTEQWNDQGSRLLGVSGGHGGCSAYLAAHRVIFCNAGNLDSPDRMLDYLTHEFSHQVFQGDLRNPTELATWYSEGLAEYVMQQVLTSYVPIYAANDAAWRDGIVARAYRRGKLLQLEHLASHREFRAVKDHDLAYSQSRLAVRYLVERHGMAAAVDVIRGTTSTAGTFDRAFEAAFGLTVHELDAQLSEALPDVIAAAPRG
jgi:hypothetical protein